MWIEFFQKKHFLKSLYSEAPELASIRVASFTLDDDGMAAIVIFDIRDFPKDIPQKWEGKNYNTVQVELRFAELNKVSCTMDFASKASNVEFEKGDYLKMKISGLFNVDLEAGFGYVSKLSAYQDGHEQF